MIFRMPSQSRKEVLMTWRFESLPPVPEPTNAMVKAAFPKGNLYVDLRAENDVLAVISNCPQINNPVNDYNPTPIRVVVWQP